MPNYSDYTEQGVSLIPQRPDSTDGIKPAQEGLQGFAQAAPLIATGAQVGGGWGAAAGAALALGSGTVNWLTARKRRSRLDDKIAKNYANNKAAMTESIDERQAERAAQEGEGDYFANLYAEDGAEIQTNPDVLRVMSHILANREKRKRAQVFRSGGQVNVIAKGVLHEEPNQLGDKGIPIVIKEGKRKIAEIEVNEIIFHRDASERMKELAKAYKADPGNKELLARLGEMVKKEILENTIDRQGELLNKKPQ